MPAKAGNQVTDSVRHTVGIRYPGYGMGMDPGFHRGDEKAGMTAIRVDFWSPDSTPLGL